MSRPTLSSFFHGRDLDSEAQRFLSLTRYGRSRAISEGVPVELWINAKQGKYGLEAVSGYTETKGNAIEDPVAANVQISTSVPSQTLTQSNYWSQSKTVTRGLPTIRFQPDGHISDSSPKDIYFKQESGSQICIEEDLSHLRYAIQAIPSSRR